MLCPKCGKVLDDSAHFCPVCGSKAENSPQAESQPAVATTVPPVGAVAKQPKKKKSKKGLIIGIVAVLLAGFFFLIGIVAVALPVIFSRYDISFTLPWSDSMKGEGTERNKEEEKTNKNKKQKSEKKEAVAKAEESDLASNMDSLLSSYGLTADVTVAVVDNKTGKEYVSNGSTRSFTSWGFYLPVYMAFSDLYPSNYSDYRYNILSSTPATCNAAANFAIDQFGGPAGITSYLRDNLNYSSTVYGRKFGEVNATADNYTSAAEAARILSQFNAQYNYEELCYSPGSFGIAVPAGATMYAQFGTENISVKNNLNVFAVVKGSKSDYSVAILTQNQASATGIVNILLNDIHVYMEGNS